MVSPLSPVSTSNHRLCHKSCLVGTVVFVAAAVGGGGDGGGSVDGGGDSGDGGVCRRGVCA